MDPPLVDSGLRCPQCDYNLTGLDVDRCPECGTRFDLERIRRRHVEPGPIPCWDDRSRAWPARFLGLCLLTWLRPSELARRLPPHVAPASVARFRRTAMLIAWALCILSLVILAEEPWFAFIASIPIISAVWITVIVTEGMLLVPCDAGLQPRRGQYPDEGWPPGWLPMLQLYRSFVPLIACLVILEAIAFQNFYGFALVAGLLWWWACIALHLAAASRPGYRRLPTCVCGPPFGLFFGLLTGLTAGYLVAVVVFAAMRW